MSEMKDNVMTFTPHIIAETAERAEELKDWWK
jgi:hypothetical protein